MDIENAIYNFIIELEIATEEEVNLVTDICGYNEEALNDIIYARSGYHDMEQYCECEGLDIEEYCDIA